MCKTWLKKKTKKQQEEKKQLALQANPCLVSLLVSWTMHNLNFKKTQLYYESKYERK